MVDAKSRARVLVVDDDEDNLESLVSFLEGSLRDVVVEGFADPSAALERAKENPFDAAIADQRMPGMTGVELLRRIPRLRPCYRILITGEAITDTGTDPAAAPDVLLRKPLEAADLVKKMQAFLSKRPRAAESKL